MSALRRYAPLRPSRGTVIPLAVRREVNERDGGYCVCGRAEFPAMVVAVCPLRPVEFDHVRASHGIGMKSETTAANLVSLSGPCHRWKTENGRLARPKLLAYIARATKDCGHADPVWSCNVCFSRFDVVGSDAPKERAG